ncbi:MAG: hypothetical protein IK015_00070 [Treponema sp.]|nr:hypothetical protein [Treponema sp.]
MKKMLVILAAVLAVALVSCESPSDSISSTVRTWDSDSSSGWHSVTNKADLVGTWKATGTNNGVTCVYKLIFSSDYSAQFKMEFDYSDWSAAQLVLLKATATSAMENKGFTVTDETTQKKLVGSQNLTTAQVNNAVSNGGLRLNASKTKLKFTGIDNEFTRQ